MSESNNILTCFFLEIFLQSKNKEEKKRGKKREHFQADCLVHDSDNSGEFHQLYPERERNLRKSRRRLACHLFFMYQNFIFS